MSTSTQPTVLTGVDFATEVKTDRLNIMWRVTAVAAVTILVISIFIESGTEATGEPLVWILSPVILLVGCFLTRWWLTLEKYNYAAWTYTLGGILSISVALWGGQNVISESGTVVANQVFPFAFVVVVFIGGLLLQPRDTFLIAFGSTGLTFLIPFFTIGHWDFISGHQFFAVLLMFISAILAAQVTGELYAVTEWALMNYQRERRTNLDLFESRNQLHKAFTRSEALSDKLKDINDQLEVASEAAEAAKNFRGQFLANMSHELRTPLNAIIGFSETMLKFPMMYDDVTLPKAYENDMSQIYNSGRQLLNLINDILDLSRVDAGKLDIYMERVELEPIIDSVQSIARGLLSTKAIELKAELPSPLPDVWADQNRLRQILVNLYSNACKFTNEGSITLKIANTNDGIQFSLSDTGSGISKDQMTVIFEEFKQASSSKGRDPRAGSGLGLAISRQLLNLMDGQIWAESEVGEGSTFHFVLQPYHKDQNATREIGMLQVETEAKEEAKNNNGAVTKPTKEDNVKDKEENTVSSVETQETA